MLENKWHLWRKCSVPDSVIGARIPHRLLEDPGLRALPAGEGERTQGIKGSDSLRFVLFAREPF